MPSKNISAHSLGRPIAQFETSQATTVFSFVALALGPYLLATLFGWLTGSDEVYGVVFILAALAVGIWVLRRTRRRVLVHQKGLYFAARFVERRIPWEAVTVVEGDFSPRKLTNPMGGLRLIRLQIEGESPLNILRFWRGTDELLAEVESATYPSILNRCQEKIKNNIPVHFGNGLMLTQDEIVLEGANISWDEIGDVVEETAPDGQRYIKLHNHIGGELLIIPAFGIPNIHVLKDFVGWVKRNL